MIAAGRDKLIPVEHSFDLTEVMGGDTVLLEFERNGTRQTLNHKP